MLRRTLESGVLGSGFLMTFKVAQHIRLQVTLQNAETQKIQIRKRRKTG